MKNFLAFQTAEAWFAVPLNEVLRIEARRDIAADLAESPLSLVCLAANRQEPYVIVLALEKVASFGLLAERVEGVLELEESQLKSLPASWPREVTPWLSGVVVQEKEQRVLLSLDCTKLLALAKE